MRAGVPARRSAGRVVASLMVGALAAAGCDPALQDPSELRVPSHPASRTSTVDPTREDLRHLGRAGSSSSDVTSFLGGATTVEEFIEGLPALYLERFAFIYDSHTPARDHVSPDNPRVVSWGSDGRTIFSWNTDADAPTQFRESVEFLQQGEDRWSAGVIDFSGTPVITEPTSCQTCHGSLNKPLWSRVVTWPGSESGMNGSGSDRDSTDARMRRLLASTNRRITPLTASISTSHFGQDYAYRYLSLPGRDWYVGAVAEAGAVMSWRHAEVLLARLKARYTDFRGYSEDAICRNYDTGFEVSDAVLRKEFTHDDHNLGVLANVDDSRFNGTRDHPGRKGTFRGGVLGSGEYLSSGYAYSWGAAENVATTVLFLMLAELWEQEPVLRKLYRQTELRYSYRVDSYRRSGTAETDLLRKLQLHFGEGSREQLELRAREHDEYLRDVPYVVGDIPSATFWDTHLEQMQSAVCRALRQSQPRDVRVELDGNDPVLRWSAPRSAEWLGGLRGYRIMRGAADSTAETVVDNTASGDSVWTDTSVPAGEHFWLVSALYDDGLHASPNSSEARATVPVRAAAPVLSGTTSFTVVEGGTDVGILSATDDDTDAEDLAWLMSGGADAAAFSLTTAGALSFVEAKDYEAPDDDDSDGSYELTVVVSDGTQADTADFTVALSNRNETPTADAGEDQSGIDEGATVTLSGHATDPDAGDSLTYSWEQTGGPTVALSAPSSATTAFTAPSDLSEAVALEFALRVTDAGGLSAGDTVTIQVQATVDTTPLWSPTLTIGARDGYRGYSSLARPLLGAVSDYRFEHGSGTPYQVLFVLAHSDGVIFRVRNRGEALSDLILEWAGETLPVAAATWDARGHWYAWAPDWLDANAAALNASTYATTLLDGGTGTACLRTSEQACPATTIARPTIIQAPLTATFEDMPASHDGTDFTFGLVFSEEFPLSYRTLRDEAFSVTGGTVRRANRQQRGSNLRWTIRVRPASANDTVTITLPETADCAATGAICTADDRPLSHPLSETVIGAASSSPSARQPGLGAHGAISNRDRAGPSR